MRTSFSICVIVVFSWVAYSLPADFGDAFMEPVPTFLGSGGPYHLDVNQEWIGESAISTTTVETDALLMDTNDGYIEVSEVYLDGIFNRMGQVRVPVTTSEDSSVRYLNVALDLDNNGRFETFPVGPNWQYEWVVVNLPIVFTGETKVVTSYFTLHGSLTVGKGRATLSTEPIKPILYGPMGWNGAGPVGGFARGETEDFSPVISGIYHYDRSPNGISIPLPPVYYDPPNRPFPPPPVYETPRGPALPWPPGELPSQPGTGEPPEIPDVDEPERLDVEPDANPIVDHGSVQNMPDIKQGENECVPAATANSLRYLLNLTGETIVDGDAFNRDLFEKLRSAMKTNQDGTTGTHIDPEQPGDNNFINGKKTADIHSVLRNGKITSTEVNPTREAIISAIKQKKNVEIVLYCYKNNQQPPVLKHMVTVVGFVQYADGRIELKIHNPDDRKPGEKGGDTASPPREATITILPGQSDRGGLIVRGMIREDGDPANDVFEIQRTFIEHLANNDIHVTVEAPTTTPVEGQMLELIANVIDKNKAVTHYQWIKDNTDIPGANGCVYFLDNATLLDSGEYSCWAYDEITETYGVGGPILVTVMAKDTMPAYTVTSLVVMSLMLGCFSILLLKRRLSAD